MYYLAQPNNNGNIVLDGSPPFSRRRIIIFPCGAVLSS